MSDYHVITRGDRVEDDGVQIDLGPTTATTISMSCLAISRHGSRSQVISDLNTTKRD